MESRNFTVPVELAGARLDQVLAQLLPEHSRSRLQQWVVAGNVQVNGRLWRVRDRVVGNEAIVVQIPPATVEGWVEPQAMDLPVVYQDEHLLVIDKPVGLVVHPGAGNREGTLQNALLHYAPELAGVPRAGIVHRLDKDTSGLMVVARTLESHTRLAAALAEREIQREYECVVVGQVISGATVDAPIGRHPKDRMRMAVRLDGRASRTHYRVLERFFKHTHLRVILESGRTHQIRVHMTHAGFPLVGDSMYGGRMRIPSKLDASLRETLRAFDRQALHAAELRLNHPVTGQEMGWQSPLPEDIRQLLASLREFETNDRR